MREIFFFAIGASIVGTIFLVSLIELIFTIRRRKVQNELEEKIHALKKSYNESLNTLTLEDEKKLHELEEQATAVTATTESEKKAIEEQFSEKIAKLEESSEQALQAAKERAKKLEHEAHQKAEDYLASRKQEVEEDLMNLVLSVTKRVLPDSVNYEAHKELVMQALRETQASTKKE